MARITMEFEVPMGHRLQTHQGKCRFPHGHNYRIEVSLLGPRGADGMVYDFSVVKKMVAQTLEKYDHAFLLEASDPITSYFRAMGVPTKTVVINQPPTAEVFASLLRREIVDQLSSHYVVDIRVWETEKCSAVAGPGDSDSTPSIVDSW